MTDYYRHIAYAHNWECEHCELKFAQKQKLEEHSKAAHNLNIKVDKTCKLCEQVIITNDPLYKYANHFSKSGP